MPGALYDRIIDEIRRVGPMPFDRYMELSLYDPEEGFFGSGRGAPGAAADFITSPEVAPVFGTLLGRWAAGIGVPAGTPLVEVGAGSGSLLDGLSAEWGGHGPIHALERSGPAREALGAHHPGVAVGSSFVDVPAGGSVVVVGNEVLDNMPSALARRTVDGWDEIVVVAEAGLSLATVSARPEVSDWCESFAGVVPVGATVAAQVTMTDWLRAVLTRFDEVYACFIDYAATGDELAERPVDSVIRAFRGHRATEVSLDSPGTTDLTVEVNVDAVVSTGAACSAEVHVETQRAFLIELGAERHVDDLLEAERRAAREGRTMDQLRARSDRIDLEALLDPSGLGGFTVFRLAPLGRAEADAG